MPSIAILDNSKFSKKFSSLNPFTKNIFVSCILGLIVAFFAAGLELYHQVFFAFRIYLLHFVLLTLLVYLVSKVNTIAKWNMPTITVMAIVYVYARLYIWTDNVIIRINDGYWPSRPDRTRFAEIATFFIAIFASGLASFILKRFKLLKH